MAGGGIKGGYDWGRTDAWAYNIESQGTDIRAMNATVLHCMGIDHEAFTIKHRGLDQRLTGVEHARIVKEILV
ncbi:MAG: DUF1501 domain-containing protein [Planctomycetes bacterium]|nr:DUF1501 domain-containing protein [Planctomycetota bacterium]